MHIAQPRRRRPPLGPVMIQLALALVGLVILLPFYWTSVASTLTLPQLLRYPPRLIPGDALPRNIDELLRTIPFVRSFANSLLLSTVSTAGQLFFCSLAGLAFAKHTFPGRDRLFKLLLTTVMIPGVVSFIPVYMMMSRIGWLDTYRALIVPGLASAVGIFWMRQATLQSIPDEMLQAARIDGASEFGIYWRIVLPIVMPALGALAIVIFLGVWNDYLGPLIILNSREKFTLPLILALLRDQYSNKTHLVITGSMLATIPVIMIFFASSRWFIRGMTAGALKG